MIRTLEKQRAHCEQDLQMHIDLVNTLEGSLKDCEKNGELGSARARAGVLMTSEFRLQSQDLARTRDDATQQVERLNRELADSQREVSTTERQSVAQDKQSLESQLDQERRQNKRARQSLDNRMAVLGLAKRKSKFAGMLS
jgi:paraquat-inducible protein B